LSFGQTLKSLRKTHNHTQKHLAEMLDTTQQTVARWESGKATPSAKVLGDLAIIYGTSIDSLLGKISYSGKVISNNPFLYSSDANIDYFWGHLGVHLNSRQHTYWFPITGNEKTHAQRSLRNLEDSPDQKWITLHTLNNRILAVNPLKVNKIWLLDEAADQPDDDWIIERDQYGGYPEEIYRSLMKIVMREDLDVSDKFQLTINAVRKELNLNDDNLFEFLFNTQIHFMNGDCKSYSVDSEQLFDFLYYIDNDINHKVIQLDDQEGSPEIYYPADALSMIDMPRIEFLDVAKAIAKEYEEDEQSNKEVQTKKIGK